MNTPLWTIAELLTYAADLAGATWYFHRKLGLRSKPFARLAVGALLAMLILAACYFLSVTDYVRILLIAAGCVLYTLTIAAGKIWQKVFQAFVAMLLVYISDVLVLAALTFIPNVTYSMLMQPTPFRLQGMIGSKLVLFLLIIILSKKKAWEAVYTATQWFMVIIVPLLSLATIIVITRYETMANATDSYSLIALSCGLFVMNIVLLVLHDRLSLNTRLLVEKEKMLQLSEVQNRYFNETLAATDNMMGFRHDIKNHLQVLSGYLEMGNTDKARGYLSEIGNFISSNEFCVKCGYPLLDAVLGSKAAIAKKQGIELVCDIQIDREIEIDQLDLCSILGNTVDNALEACGRIGSPATAKCIQVGLKSTESATELTVINTLDEADAAVLDVIKTSKTGHGHGIGLANVKRTVLKYGGSLEISHTGLEFNVRIVIPAGYIPVLRQRTTVQSDV